MKYQDIREAVTQLGMKALIAVHNDWCVVRGHDYEYIFEIESVMSDTDKLKIEDPAHTHFVCLNSGECRTFAKADDKHSPINYCLIAGWLADVSDEYEKNDPTQVERRLASYRELDEAETA